MERPAPLGTAPSSSRKTSVGTVAAAASVAAPRSRHLVEYFVVVSSIPVQQQKQEKDALSNNGTSNQTELPSPPSETERHAARSSSEPSPPAGNAPLLKKKSSSSSGGRRGLRKALSAGGKSLGFGSGSSSSRKKNKEHDVPVRSRSERTFENNKQKSDGINNGSGSNSNRSTSSSSASSTPPTIVTYKPGITARYPLKDRDESPLNDMIASFCFSTLGDKIMPRTDFCLPKIHHFVLTDEAGKKMYGTCLTIWEECNRDDNNGGGGDGDNKVTKRVKSPRNLLKRRSNATTAGKKGGEDGANKEKKKYLPRVLCLLSTWPYLTAFREYLAQLWRLATTTDLMSAPIERYVLNICSEVPAPPPGAFELRMDILNSVIRFWAPPANQPIPYVALPFHVLFECLDLSNVLFVWYALALERRILLVSSQASLLTVCAEILCSLLFPMQWSHLYIPLLPQSLSQMLDAPFPYLCGVCTENISKFVDDIGEETIVVDLDQNAVTTGPFTPELPPLPMGRRQKLEAALEKAAGGVFWRARDVTKKQLAEAYWGGGELTKRQVDGCDHYKLQQYWNTKAVGRNASEIKRPQEDAQKRIDALETLTKDGTAVWNERLHKFDDAFNLACTPDSTRKNEAIAGDDIGQTIWDTVQEAFLLFYVSTLKNYRFFLVEPGSSDSQNSEFNRWSQCAEFRREEFIEAQRVDYQPFLRELCNTQHFDDFICKRRGLPDVIFFDQAIEDKLNRTKRKFKSKVETPFLMSAKAHKVLKTVKAVEPNRSDLPFDGPVDVDDLEVQRTFVYESFPARFDCSLFGKPRPIPQMINAEFDRQAALLQRLRARYIENIGVDELTLENMKWGDNPNAEVAAFALFFSSFAPIIGRELEKFEENERRVNEEEGNWTIRQGRSTSGRDLSPDSGLFYPARLPSARTRRDLINHAASKREEIVEGATAQLDLAFDVLVMMKERDIPLGDRDVCRRMMEACGRCNDLKRARELMRMMNETNLPADSDTLMTYMNAFSLSQSSLNANDMSESTKSKDKTFGDAIVQNGKRADEWNLFGAQFQKNWEETQASFTESQKRMSKVVRDTFNFSERSSGAAENVGGESHSLESGSSTMGATSISSNAALTEMNVSSIASASSTPTSQAEAKTSPSKRKHRPHKFSLNHKNQSILKKKDDIIVTDPIKRQLVLGESLLTYLYPDLVMDTESDACPQCSTILKQDEIIIGWKPNEFRDHNTTCPKCEHRFVPRFSITSSSPAFEGSQGRNTPLYCEYLSPWVVRYLIVNAIDDHENGIDGILDPEWRRSGINATLWWNFCVHFVRFRLPLTFLLQGNFDNCLITPTT